MVDFKEFLIRERKISNNLFISTVLLSTGAGLLLGWSVILKYILYLAISLRENSYISQLWEVNPMPLNFEVYAFNWTNPQDIYNPLVKPKFKQIGPFVFKETKTKGNITWNTHNSTVSFKQYHTYYFDRKKSVADLNINITTINPVLTSAAYQAIRRNWGFWMRKGMQFSFNQFGQTLQITKPIGAFLFEGYDDIMVTMSQRLPFLKGLPPLDKFGWFYTRNGTSSEGDFNMGTAYHNFGVLESWNYSNRTQHYPGKCGLLNGTSAGELFTPHKKKDHISFFSADLCRTVQLDFETEVDVDGVRGYKYSGGASFLDNGTLYPENACYCPGECFPSGVLNISSCKYGAPGFASLPNFYNADNYYVNQVEGLQPEKDKHEFYITLEPLTGLPLRVAARLQLNLLLQPVPYLTIFENIPRVFFPVLWFEEVVEIPNYLLVLLKLLLFMPLVFQITGAFLIAMGLFLITNIICKQIIQSLRQNPGIVVGQKRTKDRLVKIKELVPLNHTVVHEFDVQLQYSDDNVCSLLKSDL